MHSNHQSALTRLMTGKRLSFVKYHRHNDELLLLAAGDKASDRVKVQVIRGSVHVNSDARIALLTNAK